MANARIFTKLDKSQGFWQMQLNDSSRQLCTFNTPFGRFCFNCMPFGIISVPEIFHRIMEQMTEGIEGVKVYVDNIIIWSTTREEHIEHLKQVFKCINKYGLKLNQSKCFINFLGKFISNLSARTTALRNLIRKSTPFEWRDNHQKEWQDLKTQLMTAPILAFFDPNRATKITTDIHEGHLGIEKCKRRAQQAVYWPGFNKDINDMIIICEMCQKHQPAQCKETLQQHELITSPLAKVAGSNPEVADIIFLIDGSSSIRSQDFEKVKSAIETFINKNEFGKTRVQIGIIQFSTKPRLEFQLDQYDDKAVLLKAVHQIQQLHGGTNTGQALNFTIDYFDSSKGGRPGKRQYLILITDGESGDNVSEAARVIRDRGLNVFAIGIGSANHAELVTISGSQEKTYHLDNFGALNDLDELFSVAARSPNACSDPEVADIIFLIDGSSSIRSQNFEQVKEAIKTFISKNEFGKTRTQIGVIQFSTKLRLEFQLDQYDDKAVLLKAVHQIQQLHGGTNIGQALNFTIDYFDSSKGGRTGKRQYLLLITDGKSGDHVSEAARAIRDRGVNVFAIGIGAANHAELVTISGSQEKAFHLDNFDTLKDLDKWISCKARSPNGARESKLQTLYSSWTVQTA
ncbi:cartilage matrix protein-like [Scyliorhinus torazame]|uniref:cartilage matrix protein-like n=1 Tax=Scyliorhinus torazame TaxID=75743 RepID=UPI003B5A8073